MSHFQEKAPTLWYQRSNATDVWEQVMHLQIAISNQQNVINARGHQLTKKSYGFQNLEQISQDFTDFKRFYKIERELQNLILNYRFV